MMSRYRYALESVCGHSRESSIHDYSLAVDRTRPMVPFVENRTEQNGTGNLF